jgi:hypothetical protein
MTKFADELFTDLMREHGPALELVRLPNRRKVPRPVWVAAGAVGLAGAITAGVTVAGGGSPAYAVTANGDGTVTVSIAQLTGVDGANGALRTLGDPVVVVPVRPGCPALDSLPVADPGSRFQRTQISGSVSGRGGSSGTITVNARGVPAGDIVLVAASTGPNGMSLAVKLIKGPAPRCVSGVPTPPVGPGGGTVHSGGSSGSITGPGH